MKLIGHFLSLAIGILPWPAAAQGGVGVATCPAALTRNDFSVRATDNLAVEVLRQAIDHQTAGTDNVAGWLRSLYETEAEHPLSALEHTALLSLRQSAIFSAESDSLITANLDACLRRSYVHLTGHDSNGGDPFGPLPRSLLSQAGPVTTVFHDAVLAPKVTPVERATPNNIIRVLLTAVALSFEPGREVFAGTLLGVLEASLNEHLVHVGIGHAPTGVRKMFRRFGRVGEFLEQITLTHQLHHGIVSRYFGAANLPPEQRALAEKTLRRLVENLIQDRMRERHPDLSLDEIRALPTYEPAVERLVRITARGNFGVNGTVVGALGMLISATPYYLLNHAIASFTGANVFEVVADVSMTAMILQSLYSHRYLHLRPGDETQVPTNRFMLWYANRTFLGQLARQLHFVHHDLPYDIERTRNGDIMAGSATDRLFLGGVRSASLAELIEMYQAGFLPIRE